MQESSRLDLTDFLIGFGIFASFVVFGVCMWLIRRERDKKKNAAKSDT